MNFGSGAEKRTIARGKRSLLDDVPAPKHPLDIDDSAPSEYLTLRDKIKAGTAFDQQSSPLQFQIIDKKNQGVWSGKRFERLTKFEYQILWVLVRAEGVAVSSAEIESFLFDYQITDESDISLNSYSGTLYTFIRILRKKLKKIAGNAVKIENRYGCDYSLITTESSI